MSQPKLRFFFREPTVDTNRPLREGSAAVAGFEFAEVVKLDEADAWDCGFAARMESVEKGEDLVSIPAYPNRKFRLSYIYVNSKAGIETPRDLEGKRVGILFWANTAGVWVRGALQHDYGVDLHAIDWMSTAAAAVPAPATYKFRVRPGADLDAMLTAGELDAVIEPNVLPSITRRDPRVRRLFRDYKSEEQAYFRRTGIFPISHVVTLRRAFVERHPEAPLALLKAYRQARDIAIDAIEGADPQVMVLPWASALLDEQRALMGDAFFSYNIADNRASLAAFVRYAHEQGLVSRPVDYAALFSPEAANLPGA